MKANFFRIAKATRHEMEIEDLHSDAWIVAEEISAKRGRAIDFSDADDQSLIMRAVNVRNVKRGDWDMRRSVRIDHEPETDEAAVKWSERLPAHSTSDPLVSLLLHESSQSGEALLAASYSQAAAYVMVFVHFDNNRQAVCAYLVVSNGTLAHRVSAAADTVRTQPSLFDHIERISPRFMPPPGKCFAPSIVQHLTGAQWGWAFEEAA